MKRVKESGAAFRKKKKAKEQEATENEGALLKFIQRTSTPAAEVAETKDDPPNRAILSILTSCSFCYVRLI
jgi:hypothetical protein